jgi:cellulose synthase/poly-beta-1,6-N-acetylglucosamine synthase-like glycosyltransferase
MGIMAYNEEVIIDFLLQAILEQTFHDADLQEIVVVASGCTDNTENVVRHYMQRDQRIKLLVQPRREGKASAINLFLENASGDIIIVESADTIPAEGTLEKLIVPFRDPKVGMTGARPIPINSKNSFIGFTVHLLWELHHKIALAKPKLGELVAFRNIIREIPKDTAVDEASIEAMIKERGYELRYISEAIVNNKGPENIRDFIKQRRRIAAGHLYVAKKQHFKVSTMSPLRIFKALFQELSWHPKEIVWTAGAIMLELVGRGLGFYDFYLKKENPYIWDIADSTKTWE